jgi:sulfite dehydrogenase (cytochrome) subunit A
MLSRRDLITGTGALAAASPLRALAETARLPFENGERLVMSYPQKRPMIVQTQRPPQLETPFSVFDEGPLTPNDAFFVRYHLSGIPLEIDPETFRLNIKGKVKKPLQLSLDELKRLPAMEIVAVNQCSGNSRGFFEPRVGGGQLGNGAMGNARWRGVALKTLLDMAGVEAGAQQATFQGLDRPAVEATPAFVKALDIDHARDGEVMLAYEMNGDDLPLLNGFPLRLVVPGWYGTYWVKHLNEITLIDKVFDGFFMKAAYRIPDNDCACLETGGAEASTRPISRLNVRSFITNFVDGASVKAGETQIRGIAFDGGSGIKSVQVSADDGASWSEATLGEDLGAYSFREWRASLTLTPGAHVLKVRATGRDDETQPASALWNPRGYMRNVVEAVHVNAS